MAIRHKNLLIRRDELTLLPVQVAEWEVPLLHLVHGEGMVQDAPGEPWADVEPPQLQDEYQRLYAKYKTPPADNGAPGARAVELVYGPFNASPLLRQAIESATFDRPDDLLGLDEIERAENAVIDAEAAAAKVRAKANRAKAVSEAETTTAEPPKKPKAAKAAAAPTSLL